MDINIIKLMALAVLVLPLFALPFIMKAAGGILERFGAWTNDRQRGLIDRSRNWARDNSKRTNATQRARLASARWGYERDADGNLLKDANGDPKKTSGIRGRIARGLSGGANFVGGYEARRDRKYAWQEENAKRIQDEEIFERLADVDKNTGEPTDRAQRYAAAAAGAGGAKSAERIRRLAMEQRKNELMNDVKRESSANVSAGAYDSGAYYWETDKDGNLKLDGNGKAIGYSDHGRAMTAIARGEGVRVNKAGQKQDQNVGTILRGNTAEKRYAAMMRSTSIGDGAALSYMMYGKRDKNGNVEIAPLEDSAFSDFTQFVGDNAGGIGPKLSHLITNDQGITGITGEKMASLHGAEFKAAASRIRQLREQASLATDPNEAKSLRDNAQSMQDAYENAYKILATDDQLKEKLTVKQVAAMQDFRDIITGDQDRVVLREYGETLKDNGGSSYVSNGTGTISKSQFGVSDLYMGNAAQFKKSSAPGSATTNTTSSSTITQNPPIQLNIQTPSGNPYPQPAQQVQVQVQQAGGWSKLKNEDVMNIYNHANTLPNNTDSAQLGSEALDELRNRGILPPASGNTP